MKEATSSYMEINERQGEYFAKRKGKIACQDQKFINRSAKG